jgi:ligand-binding sensor domain-containing protein
VTPSGDGAIWVGTFSEGLIHWKEGEAQRYAQPEGLAGLRINALLRDSKDRLWIGYHGQGIGLLENKSLTHFGPQDGLPGGYVRVIIEDGFGHILAGTAEGGIGRLSGDRFETLLEPLGAGGIHALVVQDPDTLWAGTGSGGLVRVHRQKTVSITTKNGLPDDSIFQLMLDGQDRLWCGSSFGLFHTSLSQLNAVADGRIDHLESVTFGRSDNLADFPFASVAQPSCWRDYRSRFWFSSVKGAVAFAPDEMKNDPETGSGDTQRQGISTGRKSGGAGRRVHHCLSVYRPKPDRPGKSPVSSPPGRT